MEHEMHWNQLTSLPAWTPLAKVCLEAVKISEDLYQIGHAQFAMALPYDRNFAEGLPDAPFITVLYWAPDIEAAKKCAQRQENKYTCRCGLPPSELLHNTNGTYEQIREMAGESLGNGAAERAVYSGKTGEFVHKTITLGRTTYCFLAREIHPHESPYAIEISLR